MDKIPENKNDADSGSMMRLVSRCLFYVEKDVEIQWVSPDDDWYWYRVVSVDQSRFGIRLTGINAPEGWKHDGDTFDAPIADIVTIKPFTANSQADRPQGSV
jgi:hypothetical protein